MVVYFSTATKRRSRGASWSIIAPPFIATGHPEQALAELQALQASKPENNLLKADLVETLADLNRVQEAAKLNQDILRSNPGDPGALLAEGRILIAEGKYQEAKTALESAVKVDPRSATSYYFLGIAQNSLGFAGPAKSSFGLALKLAPGMAGAQIALAHLDARSGAYADALRLANGALQANPNLPLADEVAAEASLSNGNIREGEQQLLAALERNPASLPALEMLLKLYARDGRTKEAVLRISSLVSQYPRNAGLHYLLALGYFELKDLRNSEASVRQAIGIDERTSGANALLGRISLRQGSVEQAIMSYRKEVEANPQKVANYMALESLYERQGNWEEAKKVSEAAHAIDPDSPLVANNLADLYLEHGGDINVALSLAQQAKQKMPDSPAVADTMGWAFYKVGSPELAVAQLSVAVKKAADNSMYQYHLGMAYLAAGRSDSAARSLHRALTNNPNFEFAADARTALNRLTSGPR